MRTFGMLPLDNSVQEIQRRLWTYFDRAYKLSAEIYESKQSALQSKTQEDDIAGLPDFTQGEKALIENPEISLKFDNQKLTQYSNDISAAFKSYKSLSGSWARINGYKANIYYSNSEGSKASYPASVLRLVIQAETQSASGEIFELYRIYHALNETDLPTKDQVIQDVKVLAETLSALKDAPIFDDVYNGPVLFEGQAASEAVRKTMFYAKNENLSATRKPVTGNTGMNPAMQNRVSADERIEKKVSAEGLSVVAKPLMKSFNGVPLVGTYPIDMDGTVPPESTILIENGILKNLLSGRSPTSKVKQPNGHVRLPFTTLNPMVVPGVIEVDYKDAVSKEELKKKLLEMAREEGLEYALIVREMTPNMSELKRVYKVDVKTGEEKLIRSASFKGLTLNDLRKITGAGNQKIVLNTTAGEDIQHKFDFVNGCPATFITPDAFLFKDIEVSKVSKPNMAKLPIVKNPLEM
jgi:predicted Zn-dependent protease